ncbi:unnamed protein product [Prorocentrum cordatum]|uniref:Uncharacterized protein n=1 Tax=Prorocentrum cordatum TaxID=2364126 RepID=A0ABN9RMU5_9DINO|nr:unnamed protein product [Polarella glacialis]
MLNAEGTGGAAVESLSVRVLTQFFAPRIASQRWGPSAGRRKKSEEARGPSKVAGRRRGTSWLERVAELGFKLERTQAQEDGRRCIGSNMASNGCATRAAR